MFDGSEFREGARRMAPLAAAGILDGAAFGALAVPVMGHVAPIVMSATAFSGSAQFATVAVLRDNGTLAAALLSAAALNARYLAMSATVTGPTRLRRAAACLLLTDAAWGVGQGHRERTMGAGAIDLAGWILGTALGVLAGSRLADPQALGLDAAFPAFFLWLLRDHLGREVVIGAATALALTPLLAPGLPILAAGAAAGALGVRRGGSPRRSSRLRQAGGTPAPRAAEGERPADARPKEGGR